MVSTSGVVSTMETVKSSSPGVSTTSSSTMSNLAHVRVSPGWKVTVAIAAPKSWPSVEARNPASMVKALDHTMTPSTIPCASAGMFS